MQSALAGALGAFSAFGDKVKLVVGSSLRLALGPLSLFTEIASGIREGIAGLSQEEDALKQVENTIRATGGIAGFTSEQLAQMATDLQKVSTYGEDAGMAAQAALLQFQNIRGDVFKDALAGAADFATRTGTSLPDAAEKIGRALNDPIRGFQTLAKEGIVFNAQQRKIAEQMIATGDVAGVQRVMLEGLQGTMGGAALAATETFTGAMAQMGNVIGDMWEAIAGLLTPALSATVPLFTWLAETVTYGVEVLWNFVDVISGPVVEGLSAVTTWIGNAFGAMLEWAGGTDQIVSYISSGFEFIWDVIKRALEGAVNIAVTTFSVIQTIIQNWQETAVLAVLEFELAVVKTFGQLEYFFVQVLPAYLDYFATNWESILSNAADFLGTVVENMATNVYDFISQVWSWLKGDGFDFKWTGLLEGFESTLAEMPKIAERQKSGIEMILEQTAGEIGGQLGDKLNKNLAENKAAADKALGGIGDFVTKTFDKFQMPEDREFGAQKPSDASNQPFQLKTEPKDDKESQSKAGAFEGLADLNKRITSAAFKSPESKELEQQNAMMAQQHTEAQKTAQEAVDELKNIGKSIWETAKATINPESEGAVIGA